MQQRHIVVLGAGVMGLSCAVKLLQLPSKPYKVTILASQFTPLTTSDGAGGYWEPYQSEPQHLILKWSAITKNELENLAKLKWPVSIARVEHLHHPDFVEPYWKDLVQNWKIDNKMRLGHKVVSWIAPLAKSPEYMARLMQLVKELGGEFTQYKVTSVEELVKSFSPKMDLIVNCLGLGAKSVFNDPHMFPIRGVLVNLKPQPQLLNHVIEGSIGSSITYIISREDVCLLGGTLGYNDYNVVAHEEEVKGIIKRCLLVAPELGTYDDIMRQVIHTWVGLRPGRKTTRLELDTNSCVVPIVHCYGHGGSGWTTHWGCAVDVVEHVNNVFQKTSTNSKL